jgi:hypothetical protein
LQAIACRATGSKPAGAYSGRQTRCIQTNDFVIHAVNPQTRTVITSLQQFRALANKFFQLNFNDSPL